MINIKAYITSIFNSREQFYPYAFNFLAHYKAERGIVKRYESSLRIAQKYSKVVYFKDIKVDTILRLDKILRERGYKQSYINGIHYVLKKCIVQSVKDGKLYHNPYEKASVFRPVVIDNIKKHINTKEIGALITFSSCRFENVLEEFASDLFVFQCCTGVSYSDLMTLRYDNIMEIENRYWIIGYRNKTKVQFVVPVLEITMRMINKYRSIPVVSRDLKRKEEQNIFPYISLCYYNKELKIVGEKIGLSTGLTSHRGRHTFATSMATLGVSMEAISKMLGHTGTEMSSIYTEVTMEKICREITGNLYIEGNKLISNNKLIHIPSLTGKYAREFDSTGLSPANEDVEIVTGNLVLDMAKSTL